MDVTVAVVGNSSVGKSSLIITMGLNSFPIDDDYWYHRRPYDGVYNMTVDNKAVNINPCDIAGGGDYYRARPLVYPTNTDVFLLCFSLDCRESYDDVVDKWYPELDRYWPTPIILVGTKLDLREDVEMAEDLKQQTGSELISISDGLRLMSGNPNVVRYMECSSITQTGLREIFEEAARITIQQRTQAQQHNRQTCMLS